MISPSSAITIGIIKLIRIESLQRAAPQPGSSPYKSRSTSYHQAIIYRNADGRITAPFVLASVISGHDEQLLRSELINALDYMHNRRYGNWE